MRISRQSGLVLIAMVAILATGLAPSALADSTPTLLHYYQFDGSYASAASSVVADPLGTTTPVGTTDGIMGGAAYFNGTDSMLLLEGRDVLPAGAFTLAFWEKGDTLTGGEISKGYFACDAASNPLQNLYLRRFNNVVSGGGEVSAANGMVIENQFSQFAPENISTEVWHQHTITYDASGVGYWWIDGQIQTVTPTGDAFSGLMEKVTGSGYEYEGLVLGNRLTGDRTYAGYLDEVQIYQGGSTGGMAQYLYANPGATLATYDSAAYPDPVDPGAPGVRPVNATVRHWKFDGNLNEEGGTANGTAIGNAAAGTTNGAFAGSGAVAFDGDNDAVSISADVIPTNKFSISLWTNDTSGYQNYILCDSSNYSNLLLRRYNNDYSAWAGGDDFANFVDPNTGVSATYNEWHHLVFAIDGEWGNIRVYVDGTLAMTNNIEADWGNGEGFKSLMSNLYLGNRTDLARDYAGLIDDLQIYNWNLSEGDAKLLFDNPGLTLQEVPEPTSMMLLLSTAVSLLIFRRYRVK